MTQGMLLGVEQDHTGMTPLQKLEVPNQWIGSCQRSVRSNGERADMQLSSFPCRVLCSKPKDSQYLWKWHFCLCEGTIVICDVSGLKRFNQLL